MKKDNKKVLYAKKSDTSKPAKVANGNPSGKRKRLMEREEDPYKEKKVISSPIVMGRNNKKEFVKPGFNKYKTGDVKDKSVKSNSFKDFRENRKDKLSSFTKDDRPKKRPIAENKDSNEKVKQKPLSNNKPSRTIKDSANSYKKPSFFSKEKRSNEENENDITSGDLEYSENKKIRSNFNKTPKPASKKITERSGVTKKTNYVFKSDASDTRFKKIKSGKPIVKKEFSGKDHKSERSSETLKISKGKSKENLTSISDSTIRLNRYISNAGICSRRDADILIQDGLIKVNGKVITELGYKVERGDKIEYGNKILNREKQVYILLNKPKDFITTMEDPADRKTVMQLVEKACEERVYPVGRLDRNTTGLLLLTNDGELAATLTHPRHEVKKIYQVDLDKPLTEADFEQIVTGVELEDGVVKVDDIEIISQDKKIIGLEIHEGKNRIVRRLFEHLGYEVVLLDRVMYAGLTKKDLPRGKYRMLTEKELIMLKRY